MVFKFVLLMAMCLSVALAAKRVCPCPMTKEPVCGTDGKTYRNMCELECAITEDPALTMVNEGPCEEPSEESIEESSEECDCSRESDPVCGSDGNTYDNDCMLECAMSENPSLTVVSEGPCEESEESNETDQICNCPLVKDRNDIQVDDVLTCCASSNPILDGLGRR